jgi:peptidase YpeB-like protein
MRLGLSVAILGFSTVVACAATDQTKVEEALKAQGYTTWKTIVLDNGTWEVDDAMKGGKQFDLRVDAKTLKVTSSIAE